jgi:hypothetical protein
LSWWVVFVVCVVGGIGRFGWVVRFVIRFFVVVVVVVGGFDSFPLFGWGLHKTKKNEKRRNTKGEESEWNRTKDKTQHIPLQEPAAAKQHCHLQCWRQPAKAQAAEWGRRSVGVGKGWAPVWRAEQAFAPET